MNEKNAKHNPLISVLCLTYNHKNFIKQCLDGFVMQKTNFDFIAYVGDDCSTDGTTEIVKEYEYKYPNRIKGIYHTTNTGSEQNFFDTANACKSKYVALCEGDDYWVDEYKLQKQVDFLESNPDYAICFHPTKIIYDGFEFQKPDGIIPTKKAIKKGFTFERALEDYFMHTSSVMYRWEFYNKKIEDFYPKGIISGDIYLHILHAKKGKIKMLPGIMSVYRRNPSSVMACNVVSKDEPLLKYGLQYLKLYDFVYKNITNSSQIYLNNVIIPNLNEIIDVYYRNKKFRELEYVHRTYSEYIDMAFLARKTSLDKLKRKHKKYKKLFEIALYFLILENIFLLVLFFIM